VSRSGYYAWLKHQPSARQLEDDALGRKIEQIFHDSKGTYGSPRIHQALRGSGHFVGRKRVARLMQQSGLKARSAKVYRRNPGTHCFFGAIDNKVIDVETTSTDQIWVGDVTYLKVGTKNRYMAAVIDRHSRRVLGWKLGPHRDLELTVGALDRAASGRPNAEGVIFHSDRGVEYAGYKYQNRLAKLGFIQSMKRPARLVDNAHIESFFHTMKSEATHGVLFEDEQELISTLKDYVRRYNRTRIHSSLGYLSPIDYERAGA
jgi:transposase InsO family protein